MACSTHGWTHSRLVRFPNTVPNSGWDSEGSTCSPALRLPHESSADGSRGFAVPGSRVLGYCADLLVELPSLHPLCRAAQQQLAAQSWALLTQTTRVLRHLAWEKLHSGPWQDVLVLWRDVYSFAAILQAVLLSRSSAGPPPARTLPAALKALDLAIIMGGPRFAADAHALLHTLSRTAPQAPAATEQPSTRPASPSPSPRPPKRPCHHGAAAQPASCASLLTPTSGGCEHNTTAPGTAPDDPVAPSGQAADTASLPPRMDARSSDAVPAAGEPQAAVDVPVRTGTPGGLPEVWPSRRIPAAAQAAAGPAGVAAALPAVRAPDMEAFLTRYMAPEQPVVLTGLVDHWPALSRYGARAT